MIDYEHATLKAKKEAVKAPAAGWFKTAEWRADGLYLTAVEWTAAAAREIAEKAYRYVSPVFAYDKDSGRVLSLRHVALTNEPGLDGLTDLAALAAELFTLTETPMNELLKKLLAALGLQESATETEALSAVANLKSNVAALSAQISAAPDPAKYAPVAVVAALQADNTTLSTQLAALQGEIKTDKLNSVIEQAKSAGKIKPAQEEVLRKWGMADLSALSTFLDNAVVGVVPDTTQTGGKPPQEGVAALSADEKEAARIGGWDAKTFQSVKE